MADSNPIVVEFKDLVNKEVAAYVTSSEKLGGDVQEQAKSVKSAFAAQADFIAHALHNKEPDQTSLAKLLQPTSEQITKTQQLRESKRSSPLYNHLSAISEAIPALGWVCEPSNKPSTFVKEMSDSGQFYLNKVLVEHKGKNDVHVEWANAWKATMTKLHQFVLKHFAKGFKWNSAGGSGVGTPAAASKPTLPPKPGSATGKPGVPAPPPPPPPGGPAPSSASKAAATDRSALFAELTKGDKVSSGLRKVPDELKTHKNPNLKEQSNLGPRPFRSVQSESSGKAEHSAPVAKPPVFKLEEKKWRVEYQRNRHDLEIEAANLNQTVYIFGCRECTVVVRGKLSSIVVDSCEKVGVLCDNLLSTMEFVNSKSVSGQILGSVPTVNVDKTDGCQLYISKDSLGVEIVHAKSSAFNLHVPSSDDAPEGDFLEINIPEQFKTTFDTKRRQVVTVPTDINK